MAIPPSIDQGAGVRRCEPINSAAGVDVVQPPHSEPGRLPDRRGRPTPRFSRFTVRGGRRRTVRRNEESEGTYVDLYDPKLMLAVMWIASMNILDSFFTLVHLQSGGIELNPVAAALLETGRFGFVFWKCSLIGVALLVLTLHKNFGLARMGLWIAAGGYSLLVAYHLTLFRL